MKITIKDVAEKAGVSIATASMVLNHRKGASLATREKVLKTAKALNYIPNDSARTLVNQNSRYIGILIPEIQNPFYSAIVDIMTGIVEKKGFTILLGISNNSSRQEAEYVRMFVSRSVRGVIAIPVLRDNPDTAHFVMLRSANIPFVFCTDIYENCPEPVVMCDFEKGEYEATRYLIEKGFRDFWFVTTMIDACFSRERYKGYLRALTEAQLPARKERELVIKTPRYDETYEAAVRIIEDLPEAIICINDIMSIAIMKQLSNHGIRIPEDVSLVGFDDIMISTLVTPRLTTVRQPITEICEKTVELLERKLEDPAGQSEIERGSVFRIPPELVIRETTL